MHVLKDFEIFFRFFVENFTLLYYYVFKQRKLIATILNYSLVTTLTTKSNIIMPCNLSITNFEPYIRYTVYVSYTCDQKGLLWLLVCTCFQEQPFPSSVVAYTKSFISTSIIFSRLKQLVL